MRKYSAAFLGKLMPRKRVTAHDPAGIQGSSRDPQFIPDPVPQQASPPPSPPMIIPGYTRRDNRGPIRHVSSSMSEISDCTPPSVIDEPNLVEEKAVMEFKRIMTTYNLEQLREWVKDNYKIILWYNFVKDELEDILSEYMSNFLPGYVRDATILVEMLRKILPAKVMDLSCDMEKVLSGSILSAKVDYHKDRILSTVEGLKEEKEIICNQLLDALDQIRDLKAQLQVMATQAQINYLRDPSGSVPTEEKFLDDIKKDLNEKECLQSSLLEEANRNKNEILRLNRELMNLKGNAINAEHERIKDLADLAKDVEVQENLKIFLSKQIQTLTANPEEANRAIEDWANVISSSFEEKKDIIDKTKEELKLWEDAVAKQYVSVRSLEQQYVDHSAEIEALVESILEEEQECSRLDKYLYRLEQETSYMKAQANQIEIEEDFLNTRLKTSTPDSAGSQRRLDGSAGSQRRLDGSAGSQRHLDFPDIPFMDDSDRNISMGSPEAFRRGDSPYPGGGHERLISTPSLSLDSTPSYTYPDIAVTEPSIIDLDTCQRLHIPSPICPGTQTISQPQSRLCPATRTVNPSTRDIIGVRNHIDVGQSFNMQTLHSGTSSPYHQVTRVESSIPEAGPSRMADSPFNVKHTADYTPRQFVTPFISKTRFGYTDPTAKYLNLPPGDNYELNTALRKKLLLTSPGRDEPLLVDIGVQPLPLVKTESGEHFVCDISLDVQPAGKKHISPVFTYGVAPAVTPTSARRYGQFTPRGIFQKKHYNLRRVVGPDYESPGEFFPPHNLPFDRRSPLSPMPPSPYYSDGSISWERIPSPNTTFDGTAMNRTFDSSPPPAMNRTFDASPPPAMNRTFDASPPPAMNRTYEASPSPLIKGPSYRWRTEALDSTFEESSHDGSFDISSSPGEFDRSRATSERMSPLLNQTFDRSRSPRLDATFDRSTSPRLDGTFSMSPSSGSSYDRSMSPRPGGIYDRSMSPSPGGVIDGSMSPYSGGSWDRSIPSSIDSTFDSSMSNMSPKRGGIYDRSMSPSPGGVIDCSMSPYSGGSWNRSIPSTIDSTSDSSMSLRSGGTYDKSTHSQQAFLWDPNRSSPRSGGTSDHSTHSQQAFLWDPNRSSPRSGGTSDHSTHSQQAFLWDPNRSSPRSGGTSDHSTHSQQAFLWDPNRSSPRSGGTSDRSTHSQQAFLWDPNRSSPRSGGTYDRSSSPRSAGTYDRSSSPRSAGTYDRSSSPRSAGTYDRSSSPRSAGTYDRSVSSRQDSSFDRSGSTRSGGTYDSGYFSDISSHLGGTFDSSMSPSSGGSYDQSMSPGSGGSYDHSMSPGSGGSYDRNGSPKLGDSFNDSPPDLNRAFNAGHSNQLDDSPRGNSSPRLDRRLNFDNFPRIDRTHNVNISSRVNASSSSEQSPQLNRTYDRSESPQLKVTFEESAQNPLNRTFDADSAASE